MKPARPYFQSIARNVPRGAVPLRPQSGILQRWQAAPAPAWISPVESANSTNRAVSQLPAAAAPEAPAPVQPRNVPLPAPTLNLPPGAESPLATRPGAGHFEAPTETAFAHREVAATLPEPPMPAEFSVAPPIAAATQRVKPASAASVAGAPPFREGPAPAESAGAPRSARAAAPEPSAPLSAPVRRDMPDAPSALAPQSPERPMRSAVALPPPAPVTPARPAIHIGAIEVHLLPAPAPPPAPVPSPARSAAIPKAPLSRGYLSRFGWDQA